MNKLLFILALTLVFSCKNNSKEDKAIQKEELVMYNPSELTLVMEKIYTTNEIIKKQILNGETPSKFPDWFLKIHTAEMTDRFERDSSFKIFANNFIKSQKSIYKSSSKNAKSNFNNTINSCIACHKTTCTGPIPRIKKLLIK